MTPLNLHESSNGDSPQKKGTFFHLFENKKIKEIIDFLKNRSPFSKLNEDEYKKIARLITVDTFSEGKEVFDIKAPPADLFIIREGKVRIWGLKRIEKMGIQSDLIQQFAILSEGQIIGDMCCYNLEPRSAFATALSPSTIIYRINKIGFENLMDENASIAQCVLYELTKKLDASNETLLLQNSKNFSPLNSPKQESPEGKIPTLLENSLQWKKIKSESGTLVNLIFELALSLLRDKSFKDYKCLIFRDCFHALISKFPNDLTIKDCAKLGFASRALPELKDYSEILKQIWESFFAENIQPEPKMAIKARILKDCLDSWKTCPFQCPTKTAKKMMILNSCSLFKNIGQEQKFSFIEKIALIKVKPGQIIYKQDEKNTSDMCVIGNGIFSVVRNLEEIALLEKGKHFGEMALIIRLLKGESSNRTASVSAVSYGTLLRIDFALFRQLFNEFNGFRQLIFQEVIKRIRRNNELCTSELKSPKFVKVKSPKKKNNAFVKALQFGISQSNIFSFLNEENDLTREVRNKILNIKEKDNAIQKLDRIFNHTEKIDPASIKLNLIQLYDISRHLIMSDYNAIVKRITVNGFLIHDHKYESPSKGEFFFKLLEGIYKSGFQTNRSENEIHQEVETILEGSKNEWPLEKALMFFQDRFSILCLEVLRMCTFNAFSVAILKNRELSPTHYNNPEFKIGSPGQDCEIHIKVKDSLNYEVAQIRKYTILNEEGNRENPHATIPLKLIFVRTGTSLEIFLEIPRSSGFLVGDNDKISKKILEGTFEKCHLNSKF